MATKGSRRLFDRLGRIAVVAGGVLVTGSLVAYYAEHPANPGFATVGDALWWGIVTLTTVGYGDIVPQTPTGRFAAVTIMITGVAVLGLLAGSLASFFRLDGGDTAAGSPAGEPASTTATSSDAPTFLAYAAKDALGANLDRIQIIKCWTARGMLFEKVYDVAASGGRSPDRHGALPPVGDTVDASTATYRNDIGAAELSAAWTDPDFDPLLACVYYARILEIPTPRWSTYDAVEHGKPLPDAVPASVQQRAWTSPVWYTPSEQDRGERTAAEGMYTVADLADRGIGPMTDDEIRAVTVGRTVRSVNLITGFEATLHYGADGNRSVMGLGDRPVVTPYEIRGGRRIETTLLGERMSVALFSVGGRTLGARDDEAGYVNYEAFTTS